MGKDLVFWIKLPASDPEGKRFIAQWQSDVAAGLFPGAYASFKNMPLSRQETIQEIRAENATRPEEHHILLDPFLYDDEKVVVKLVRNHWEVRYPYFAYSNLEIRNGYVCLSDGCRLHLNIGYQLKNNCIFTSNCTHCLPGWGSSCDDFGRWCGPSVGQALPAY